jgi:catechol 2,3-dioxygenase-like lactoylglutathione lyase family enzyme
MYEITRVHHAAPGVKNLESTISIYRDVTYGFRAIHPRAVELGELFLGVFPGFHESSWHLYYSGRL